MVIEKVREAVGQFRLLDKHDKVIVGVSGGADSACLLYALNSLKEEYKISLFVAHLDHSLREDSAKDKNFVESLARKLGLPFIGGKVNVRNKYPNGSVEEAARKARFEFFLNAAKKVKAKKIALAHNFDDQAETVLMRIIRGTGLYGLIGILPKRKIGGAWVIRPLLKVRRKEIEKFLRSRKISFRTDRSNFSDLYLRNKIRNSLFPILEKEYNKRIKESLCNLADSAGSDYDFLSLKAQGLSRRFRKRIDLKAFKRLHTSMQRMLLRKIIADLKGDTRRIDFRHLKELDSLVYSRPLGSVVDLPGGLTAQKTQKKG